MTIRLSLLAAAIALAGSACGSSSQSFTYHCTIHPGMVGTITVQ